MIRTQIYITAEERSALHSLSKETGLSQSELIRQAIDHFCLLHQPANKIENMRQAQGMWEDHDDLPDFEQLRKSFGRDHKDKK